MFEKLLLTLADSVGGALGAILALALATAAVAAWDVELRIREKGPNRDALIRWLRQGAWRPTYRLLLTRVLNWLDRKLGDAGRPELSLPSPFGNRCPAPYWTGPALDICALLAIVYPLL